MSDKSQDIKHGIEVHVECYAGYRADERPQRFSFGQRNIEVEEIIDQWQGENYRYFKLKGDDGGHYILRHDEASQRWELTMYSSEE